MRKFVIGQRVICIAEFNVKRKFEERYPEKGKTYTIRGFVEYHGEVGILLEEIVNISCQYSEGYNEAAFGIHNFRPEEYQSATSEILDRFPVTEERSDVKIRKELNEQIQITNKKPQMKNKYTTFGFCILLCTILLSSCAPTESVGQCVGDNTYGFLGGLWHGIIVLISFFISLFNDDVSIYAVNNNGGWYDFGFLIGIGGFGGIIRSSTR